MENEIPNWLNETFLVTALQGGEDKVPKVSIVSFEAAEADAVNFSSDIFRIKVHYKVGDSNQERSRCLIVKATDADGLLHALLGPSICEKELMYYTELLPKMMKKVQCNFAPESFYSPVDRVTIMEDLKPGYVLGDSHKQLDLEHCKWVLETLAKFHASSVAVYQENPELIKYVGREFFFPEGSGPLKNWVEMGTRMFGEALSKTEEYKKYAEFYLSRADNIWDLAVKSAKPRPGRLNVLNHGDLWTNNVMFKYNECKEIVDIKFIDYQSSRYTTPTADLIYFIYSSAEHEVREHRQKDLYSHYLEVLNATLQQLGCTERLTLQQLKEDLESMIPFFISVTAFAFSLIYAGAGEDAQNFDGLTSEDFIAGKANPILEKLLQGKVLNERIRHIARQYCAFIES